MIGRLTALGSTAVAALALAGSAPSAVSAPPAQLLAGTYQTKTGPGVAFEVNIVDDTTFPARTTIYVPAGYILDLSRPPGSTIGRMDAFFYTPSSVVTVFGSLHTGDPATLPGDPAAQACVPGAHAAVWTASFKAGGKSHTLRVFVDATTGADTVQGAYKLVTCFEPPSASGLQRSLFDLALSGPGGSVLTARRAGPTCGGCSSRRTPAIPGARIPARPSKRARTSSSRTCSASACATGRRSSGWSSAAT